jgi:hypothetical protein
MAEKDPPKGNEKTDQQIGTTQLTPEMRLFLTALTGTFTDFQRTLTAAQPTTATPEITTTTEFTGNAKIAVEKFNDILAGLALKPPLTPILIPPSQTKDSTNKVTVTLTWNMPVQVDTLSSFKVQRAQGPQKPNEPFFDLTPTLGPDKRSGEDKTVTIGETYRYRVVALTTNRGEYVSNVQEIKIS